MCGPNVERRVLSPAQTGPLKTQLKIKNCTQQNSIFHYNAEKASVPVQDRVIRSRTVELFF